ncbi:formyltransferase family protein [Streptomyces sp. NPDC046985]|uniref:formyltransferase family protein n=1 Tax=Streptomyces sp. NPDC046985 TaxID=3155377 RepID=UPI00340ACE6C
MSAGFFLVTEATYHAAHLRAAWERTFADRPGYGGIAVRADRSSAVDNSTPASGWLDHGPTDDAMERLFGPLDGDFREDHVWLGPQINGPRAASWLSTVAADEKPLIFVFLDRMLAPWWMKSASAVLNSHSAVLPHARGTFAIENVGAERDIERFRASLGATVHYVDEGVDTGPIIQASRVADPFASASIWECKARSFQLAFDLLIDVADRFISHPAVPVGTAPAPSPWHGPDFRRRDFTEERRKAAEEGFLAMRNEVYPWK